jgi:hypothetical protein
VFRTAAPEVSSAAPGTGPEAHRQRGGTVSTTCNRSPLRPGPSRGVIAVAVVYLVLTRSALHWADAMS